MSDGDCWTSEGCTEAASELSGCMIDCTDTYMASVCIDSVVKVGSIEGETSEESAGDGASTISSSYCAESSEESSASDTGNLSTK